MILALICTLSLCGGLSAPQQGSPAVELEWSVREWALDPAAEAESIVQAARDADWKRRHGAFDALARAAPRSITAEQEQLARVALTDEHPNVRAQALAALATHGAEVGELAERLVEDSLPEVRRELARALALSALDTAGEILFTLTEDEDPRVAREATDQLLAHIGGVGDSQRELWRSGRLDHDPETFLHVLDALDRSANGHAFGDWIRSEIWSRDLGIRGDPLSPEQKRKACLWYSLIRQRYLPVLPCPWSAVWLQPLGPEHSSVERRRQARLLEWAESLGSDVGLQLLQAAGSLDAEAQLGGAGAADAAERASDLLMGAAVALAGARAVSEGAPRGLKPGGENYAPTGERTLYWSADFAIEFWDAVLGRATGWNPADEAWLDVELDSEVRAAVIDAFADTWTRTLDGASGDLLVEALGDPLPDLAHGAWLALARTDEGVRRFRRPLHTWWSEQALEAKLEALREVNREVPLDTPWREELVRLWASGEGRTVSVTELLGAHRGDEEVEALLRRWVDEAIAVLEASPVPDEETTRGPWREAETSALWLTRAWLHATGANEIQGRMELLRRVGHLGKELGKILITDLEKRPGGRVALRSLLESPKLSRRLRIEIVLVDETIDSSAAFELLVERYDRCDQELRLRIALRLADFEDPRSRELLLRVALDAEAGPGERGLAIDSLAAAGTPAEVEPLLLRIIDEAGDLDLARAAVAELASAGSEASATRLYAALADPDSAPYLRDVILPALAGIEVRRGVAPTPRLVAIWAEEAQLSAGHELEVRFRGERLSSRAFAYSGLIGATETFVRAGVLEAALALAGAWWRFDARLLMELGATATETGGPAADPIARRLNLAALIGLVGEGEAPDREGLVAKARARLLRIAWRQRNWREAEGWAGAILEDWRSGRTTRSGFEAAFGARDVELERDPTEWLIACQLQARAWQALEAGQLEWARRLAKRALRTPHVSRLAAAQQEELEAAIERE